MTLSPTARTLYDAIAEMAIIDAHEHLPPEKDYLAFGYSGLNLFANYLRLDLLTAGLDAKFFETMRTDVTSPVDAWWPKIKPFYEASRHTGYAQALRITARDLWGIADINDRTVRELAARVKADNTPGLYRRILQDRCKARWSITCVDRGDFPNDPCLRGITWLLKPQWSGKAVVAYLRERTGQAPATLDDAVAAVQSFLHDDVAKGAVGFKMAGENFGPPDAKRAADDLRAELADPGVSAPLPALRDYLFDKCLDVARDADVPVAVHSGYWGDFRELDPKNFLGFAARRPDVRFDMFHLGYPMMRDAALIGKNLPNVTLNLCWLAVVSPVQLERMLDELLDLVPVTKITAFGGDYRVAVQKAWGHLVLARRCVASALARRVDAGDFDAPEALRIAKLWFHDNPSRIYRLED